MNLRTLPSLCGILSLLTLLLSGCNTVNTVTRGQPVGQPDVIADDRIITDSGLNNIAQIVRLSQSRTAADHLKIQVELFNNSRSVNSFRYRFEWLDGDGMLIEHIADNWELVTMEGKESRLITEVSPHQRAQDFRFMVIEVD